MGATNTAPTKLVQLDFLDKFYFPPDSVIHAGAFYRLAAAHIDIAGVPLCLYRIAPWRRKRQIASYVTVTSGGFAQSTVAQYLHLTRNSVYHACRTVESLRDERETFDRWLVQLEDRL